MKMCCENVLIHGIPSIPRVGITSSAAGGALERERERERESTRETSWPGGVRRSTAPPLPHAAHQTAAAAAAAAAAKYQLRTGGATALLQLWWAAMGAKRL